MYKEIKTAVRKREGKYCKARAMSIGVSLRNEIIKFSQPLTVLTANDKIQQHRGSKSGDRRQGAAANDSRGIRTRRRRSSSNRIVEVTKRSQSVM